MPDIARVIFDKIETCAVFVPDLSITGRNDAGARPTPNPNVLIELGYALRAIGHERIVGVFNEASGSRDELLFDLRSRRWPISFLVTETSTQDERAAARERLVRVLAEGIGAAASRAELQRTNEQNEKTETTSSYGLHGRFNNGQVIAYIDTSISGAEIDGQVVWRNAPQATIEIKPSPGVATDSYAALRARAIRQDFSIQAFGPRGAQWYSRNVYGFIAGDIISNPQQPRALCITQLDRGTCGLYGINQAIVEHHGQQTVILGNEIRAALAQALENYLEFYRLNRDLGDSLSMYATFQNIGGTYLQIPSSSGSRLLGPIVDSLLYHSIDRLTVDADPHTILVPLLEKLWDTVEADFEP